MNFELYPLRCELQALEAIRFGAHAGNTLRGALGLALLPGDATWFRPERSPSGPSGLADPPRPFVLRASHLDGATAAAGSSFSFGLHCFDTRHSTLAMLEGALQRMAEAGLGVGRGRARLGRMDGRELIRVPLLASAADPVRRIRIRFLTPTELKGAEEELNFRVIVARARDRVSTLMQYYGGGAPANMDYRGLGERAGQVSTIRQDLRWETGRRTSTRTGQSHPLGGFTGEMEFEGPENLGEFVPWLEAAAWAGIGRQTVWGKGAFAVEVLSPGCESTTSAEAAPLGPSSPTASPPR